MFARPLRFSGDLCSEEVSSFRAVLSSRASCSYGAFPYFLFLEKALGYIGGLVSHINKLGLFSHLTSQHFTTFPFFFFFFCFSLAPRCLTSTRQRREREGKCPPSLLFHPTFVGQMWENGRPLLGVPCSLALPLSLPRPLFRGGEREKGENVCISLGFF